MRSKVRILDKTKVKDELAKTARLDAEMGPDNEAGMELMESGIFGEESLGLDDSKLKPKPKPKPKPKASPDKAQEQLKVAKKKLKQVSDMVTEGKSWPSKLTHARAPYAPYML